MIKMCDKDVLLKNVVEEEEINFDNDCEDNFSHTHKNGEDVIEKEEVDIDEFLRQTGEFGKFQIITQLLIMLTMISHSYIPLVYYFIGHDPQWQCTNLELHSNGSICLAHNNTPRIFEHASKERCHMNRSEWKFINDGRSTIVTNFDLVCDRAWLDAFSGSVVFIGWGVGIIILGYLSDRYGRKKVMYPAFFLTLMTLMCHAFVQNIQQLIIIRFIMGIMYSGPALNSFVLILELVGPSKRVFASSINSITWIIGGFLMTIQAYFITNWRNICLACSIPYVLGIFTYLCVPESIRWLSIKGRKQEVEAILQKAARMNKMPSDNLSIKVVDNGRTNQVKTTYIDLFCPLKMLILTISQSYIWFNSGMTYYVLSWVFSDLGGDMYVNFLLSMVIEGPAIIVSYITLRRFGRRKTTIFSYFFTGLFCAAIACTPFSKELKSLRIIFGLVAKFTISISFCSIYVWSSEILATSIRTQGMGICIVTSRVGAAMSPFISILNKIHPAAPFILISVTSILAAVVSCALPETLNQPTRETIADMFKDKLNMRAMFSITDSEVTLQKEKKETIKNGRKFKRLRNYELDDDESDNLLSSEEEQEISSLQLAI